MKSLSTLRKIALFVLVQTGILTPVLAGQFTWNGSQSNLWNNTSNWTPNGLPGNQDTITINNASHTVQLDQNRSVHRIIMNNGTINLNSFELLVTQRATFNDGAVNNGTLKLRGTFAYLQGTDFDCSVDVITGQLRLSGGVFQQAASFEQNGSASGWGEGGCVFNATVTVRNSGTAVLRMANTQGDVFNADVNFISSGSGALQPAHNGSSSYNGNITISCTNTGGINFCNGTNGGSATLASGKTLTAGVGGLTAGVITLRNLTQNGSTAQSLSTTGSSTLNIFGCVFNGNATFSAPSLLLRNSTFHQTATLTKTGNAANHWDGGNSFKGDVTISNTTTGSGILRLAVQNGDTFEGNATFTTSTGFIQGAFSDTTTFMKDISINSSRVTFNNGNGWVEFSGAQSQNINGSADYFFTKVILNKTSSEINSTRNMAIDSSLNLISGLIIPDANDKVILNTNCTLSGGSKHSHIVGTAEIAGGGSRIAPVGDRNTYAPVGVNSSVNSVNQYRVSLVNVDPVSYLTDTSIAYVIGDHNYVIEKNTNSSVPNLQFHWNTSFGINPSITSIRLFNVVLDDYQQMSFDSVSGNSQSGILFKSGLTNTNNWRFGLGLKPDTLNVVESDTMLNSFALGVLNDSLNPLEDLAVKGASFAKSQTMVTSFGFLDVDSSSFSSHKNALEQHYTSLLSKKYSSIIEDGDTISDGGYYFLNSDSIANGITFLLDSSERVYIRTKEKLFVNSGARNLHSSNKRGNIVWLTNEIILDSLIDFSGKVYTGTARLSKINYGACKIFALNQVQVSNPNSSNDYIYLLADAYLNNFPKLLAPFTGVVNPCNLILNPDLEAGALPTSKAGIAFQDAIFWDGQEVQGTGACSSNNGLNTADLFDANVQNSTFSSCVGQFPPSSVGVPTNFASDNVVGIRANGNRMLHAIENESFNVQLNTTFLESRPYLLDFYYAFSSCNPINAEADLCFNFLGPIGNITAPTSPVFLPLGQNWKLPPIPQQGAWSRHFAVLDISNATPQNIAAIKRLSMHVELGGALLDVFMDDFSLIPLPTAGPDQTICAGQQVTLGSINNCPLPTNVSINYYWSPALQNVANPTDNPNVTTTYSMTMEVLFNGYVQDTYYDYVTITVLPVPPPTVTFTPPSPHLLCIGSSVNACSNPAFQSYLWSDGSTNQCLNVNVGGLYTLTVTDQNGCTGQGVFEVIPINCCSLEVNNISSIGSCISNPQGSISGSLINGTAPYDISWQLLPSGAPVTLPPISTPNFTITNLLPGNYSVIVTDANGCTDMTTIIVDEISCCSLSVNLTAQNPCVQGQSGSIAGTIVNGTAPFVIIWQEVTTGQSGALSQSGTAFNFNGLPNGTYDVLVTDANNCTATAQIAIFSAPSPPTPLISGTTSACNDTVLYMISNPVPGTSYSWSFNPAFSLPGATVSFNPVVGNSTSAIFTNTSSNYLITVTATNSYGCTSVGQIAVNSCCTRSEITVVDGTQDDIGPNWSNFTLEGVFTVTANTVWDGRNVTMGAGAQIRINPGVVFEIRNSSLIPCDYFWRSITVNHGSLLRLANSTIQGAQYAVDVQPGGGYLISENTRLYDNYVGIRVNGTPSNVVRRVEWAAIRTAPVSLYNSLLNFLGQTPATSNSSNCNARPFAGILLDFAGVNTVGSLLGGVPKLNIADGVFGIHSRQTFLRVVNTFIENIDQDNCQPVTFNSGTAIFAASAQPGNTFSQGNAYIWDNSAGGGWGVVIKRSRNGIRSNGIGLIARECRIFATEEGVRAFNLPTHIFSNKLDCNDNIIEFARFGIRVGQSDFDYHAGFTGNQIYDFNDNVGPASLNGALVVSTNPIVPGSYAFVSGNEVSITENPQGIRVEGLFNLGVNNNDIMLNRNGWQRGVFTQGCNDVSITSNTIIGKAGVLPPGRWGVSASGLTNVNSNNTRFWCNTANYCSDNIRFAMGVGSMDFDENTMDEGNTGLKLINAILGNQLNKFNQWCAPFNSFSIDGNQNSSATFNYPNPSSISPTCDLDPTQVGTVQGNFIISLPTGSGSADGCPENFVPDTLGINDFDRFVATLDTIDSLDVYTVYNHQRMLMKKLVYNQGLLSSDSIVNAFWTAMETSDMASVSGFERRVSGLYDSEVFSTNDIRAVGLEIRNRLMEIDAIDSLMLSDSLPTDSLILTRRYDLQAQVDSMGILLDSMIKARNTIIADSALIISADLNATIYSAVQAQTEKQVQMFLLKYGPWNNVVISPDDSAIIRDIALLCAHEYGPAVIWARAFYSDWYEEELLDENICGAGSRFAIDQQAETVDQTFDVHLQPNPAQDRVEMNILGTQNSADELYRLQVRTLAGQIVNTVSFSGKIYKLAVDKLPTGMYVLEIGRENSQTIQRKLVIAR